MLYSAFKDWANNLFESNKDNKDAIHLIKALQAVLNERFSEKTTINTIKSLLFSLIELDARGGGTALKYPLMGLQKMTAGLAYESFNRSTDEFYKTYPTDLPKKEYYPEGVKRKLALLDIDHTLLFGDRLNMDLLNALKKRGIYDVYLFTDMYFDEGQLSDRKKLIQDLTLLGFNVHGVIAPADYTWNIKESLNGLQDQLVENDIDLRAGRNTGKTAELLKNSPLQQLIEQKVPLPDIACAYAEVAEKSVYTYEDTTASVNCKLALDLISLQRGTASPKTLMMEQFLQKKPKWVEEVIAFDDKEDNIEAIQEAAKHSDIPVRTVLVKPKTNEFDFGIEIDNKPEDRQILSADFRSDLIAELKEYIDSRSGRGFWLFHNKQGLTETKIENARTLISGLQGDRIQTVGDAKKFIHDAIRLNKTAETEFKKTYLSGSGKFDDILNQFKNRLEEPAQSLNLDVSSSKGIINS